MQDIKDRFRFEPNANARQGWLGTRKKPFTGGNQPLEGFYQTKDFDKDTRWVMIAVFIEIIAIALTLYGGGSKGGFWFLGSIITVILFVVFDFIGAIWYHSQKAEICFLRNKILIATDAGTKAGLQNRLKKLDYHWKTILGAILILFSAVLKIAAILLLGKFKIIFYIILLLFYFIVVYIHFNHTGYFLAEWWDTGRQFKKQHEEWANDVFLLNQGMKEIEDVRHKARKLNTIFESEFKLNIPDEGLPVGEHSIKYIEEKNNGNNKVYVYELETIGILHDDDIIYFTCRQNPEQAGIIARNILKHQIEIIHP